ITDDYSRFSWVFFLASKDETPSVLKTFIIGLENLLSLKVKIIRCDNGTEFKNFDLNQFWEEETQIYVLFPVLSDGSTNSQNNNKDALVDGKEHDDDIQNTNDFSAAGPSNAAASPIAANSSDMPNLEDLSHSNDADDVGAEADINNLESIISVSPIPTTRIHKDHPTSQIIGDISSTTQTRSMAKTVRDQGGISQMFNEDFHTCMFACFLSQEEPT
nr:putative ribonuclease H-like domain-containing protein [Tanacetum cinerariifolium]